MDRLDQFFGVHGTALQWRARRMDVLASNIANAATPHYKARDLDFGALMARSTASTLARTDARHLAPAAGADAALLWRQPNQPSLDGNTVELATEQMAFAETAVRYRSTLAILSGRIQSLQSALRVD